MWKAKQEKKFKRWNHNSLCHSRLSPKKKKKIGERLSDFFFPGRGDCDTG